MNTLHPILVVDVNVIIHLEKVNLLDLLANDKNIRIVDLVLYQEYEYKRNTLSDKVLKIRQLHLDEKQMEEAHSLYISNSRNSVFDYYSYIAARDNKYELLTGDWKLKKTVRNDIEVHGAIWYVQKLREKGLIDDIKLKNVYETWLNDSTVFIDSKLLRKLIMELNDKVEL